MDRQVECEVCFCFALIVENKKKADPEINKTAYYYFGKMCAVPGGDGSIEK